MTPPLPADPVLLQRITEWVKDSGLALADLGYQSEVTSSACRPGNPKAEN
jgi:hypothetical protein